MPTGGAGGTYTGVNGSAVARVAQTVTANWTTVSMYKLHWQSWQNCWGLFRLARMDIWSDYPCVRRSRWCCRVSFEQADQAALVLPLVTSNQAEQVILVVVASAEMLCRLIRLMDVPVHQAAVAQINSWRSNRRQRREAARYDRIWVWLALRLQPACVGGGGAGGFPNIRERLAVMAGRHLCRVAQYSARRRGGGGASLFRWQKAATDFSQFIDARKWRRWLIYR